MNLLESSAYDDWKTFKDFGGNDDGLIGKTVKFEDWQFELEGSQYSADGVATFYGGYIKVVIDILAFYDEAGDEWSLSKSAPSIRVAEEFLETDEEFYNYVLDLLEYRGELDD